MRIINIHTTTSTNDFLKNLLSQENVDNFTVIQSMYQSEGRGQRGNQWLSEEGKNLIFSILIKKKMFPVFGQFALNKAVSIGVLRFLENYFSGFSIKWPNDIMADQRKIAGILIENSIKGAFIQHSIVGIGININQTTFGDLSQKAVSLHQLTGVDYSIMSLVPELQQYLIESVTTLNPSEIDNQYHQNLWGKDLKLSFMLPDQSTFKGYIQEVNAEGQLVVKDKDGWIRNFELKQIQYGYDD